MFFSLKKEYTEPSFPKCNSSGKNNDIIFSFGGPVWRDDYHIHISDAFSIKLDLMELAVKDSKPSFYWHTKIEIFQVYSWMSTGMKDGWIDGWMYGWMNKKKNNFSSFLSSFAFWAYMIRDFK